MSGGSRHEGHVKTWGLQRVLSRKLLLSNFDFKYTTFKSVEGEFQEDGLRGREARGYYHKDKECEN